MRTNIDIDDGLIAEAMTVIGVSTKKAAVEEALRRLVDGQRRRAAIVAIAGLGWEGDLESMRERRAFPEPT